MLDCKRWTSPLSAAKGDCTPRAKSDIYNCLVDLELHFTALCVKDADLPRFVSRDTGMLLRNDCFAR